MGFNFRCGDQSLLPFGDPPLIPNSRYPGWYFNLKADPKSQIQVGSQRFNVTAEQADPEQKKRLWAQLIKIFPRYAGYQERTSREIPMLILHPID